MTQPHHSTQSAVSTAIQIVRLWLSVLAVAFVVVGLVSAWILGPELLGIFTSSWVATRLHLRFFQAIFVLYPLVAICSASGVVASSIVGLRARRRGNHPLAARAGRAFILCASLLLAVCLSEAVFSWQLRSLAGLAHLPTALAEKEDSKPSPKAAIEPEPRPEPDAGPLRRAPAGRESDSPLDIAIIGESSAVGLPFYPWVSLDKLIAWQLGRALPAKKFRAVNLAKPGMTLRTAIELLSQLERRPALLIVYSGHNEFQSRFGWGRKAPHYRVEPKLSSPALYLGIRSLSATADFLGVHIDRFDSSFAPKPRVDKDRGESPCCTPAEYAATLEDYRRRLDALLGDCDALGIPTMVIVPPSNEGAFDPNRSVLSPETSLAAQRSFSVRFKGVVRGEQADPGRAIEAYRQLIAEQPGFAETHYRLARLLETSGSFDEAREEYIKARDLDAIPFRCQTPFLEACREVGKRHKSIVVDAPRLFASASPHGIVNDRLFHDAHHPALNGFVIMARDAVRQLKERGTFEWPEASPAPAFTMADCIRQFKLGKEAWISACNQSMQFYLRTAVLPRDHSWRDSVGEQYVRAVELLKKGKSPDEMGIPALKIHEELFANITPN